MKVSVIWERGVSESSHPELKALHPLSHHLVFWGGGVSHLDLEQVIASRSITVLVKHNRGAGATCTENKQNKENRKYKKMTNQRTKRFQKFGWEETTVPLIKLLSDLKEIWPFKVKSGSFVFTYLVLNIWHVL